MNHRMFFMLAAVCVALPSPAAQFKLGPHTFTLPDGFEMQVVAGTDLVPRPIEADFDEQGRLYVTDSSGSNDKVQKQLEDRPHRILRLEDTDGDGRFDKQVVFADRMSFLEGAMWLDGSLYVSAPPSIWKLTDTNNDGVADVRVEWFQGKTLTGCANDLHGPYAGPDGWIYWCKGAFAKQTYTLPDGGEFSTRASHIFRARPDGSKIEPVMTGGMDNPVGLAFTPEGERILSCTFFQHPEAGHRDGLIHAIYGGVYGKPHDVLDDHVRTGDLMPVLTHLGPAAPCGIIRYEADALGMDYRNNLFVCSFNLHKIVRSVLQRSGATYTTVDSDFLVSDNPDFHPTDILEDADGSLLVIDTGGWYKLCCPTSQLYKPDVLGAIYRIRRAGARPAIDPRGLKISFGGKSAAELTAILADPRPRVAARAIQELARRKNSAVPLLREVLAKSAPADAQRNAIWALTRIDSPEARQAVLAAVATGNAKPDERESVTLTALHSISLWRNAGAMPAGSASTASVFGALPATGSPATKRALAEYLGRSGAKGSAVRKLFEAAESTPLPDRVLEHSLTYALIELNDPASTRAGLQSASSSVKRIALIALDQMRDAKAFRANDVLSLLRSTDPVLKQTASWIVAHHADWGGSLAEFFVAEFPKANDARACADLQDQLIPLAKDEAIQQAISSLLAREDLGPQPRIALLRTIAGSGLKEMPATWNASVIRSLQSPDHAIVREAVAASRSVPPRKGVNPLRPALLEIASDGSRPEDIRIAALAAADDLPAASFPFAKDSLAPAKPLAVRSTAASLLARAKLSTNQLAALLPVVKTAGPLELSKLLAAFGRSHDETIGLKLLQALKDAAAFSSLRAEMVTSVLSNYPPVVREQAQPLVTALNADAAKEKLHIEELLSSMKAGDVRRGQAVFNSEKTACASCHAIGYLGGKVGPDLTRIGQIRTERDLLEAIVYPSASFVRSYEPMIVGTKAGDEFSGVLRKDAPDEVVLVTGPNAEQHIPRSDISEMRPGNVSVMPSGLAEQLSKEELADLLAFLKATIW